MSIILLCEDSFDFLFATVGRVCCALLAVAPLPDILTCIGSSFVFFFFCLSLTVSLNRSCWLLFCLSPTGFTLLVDDKDGRSLLIFILSTIVLPWAGENTPSPGLIAYELFFFKFRPQTQNRLGVNLRDP